MKNAKLLVLILSLVACIALIWRFWDVAAPFFTAALFAYLLNPLVNRICKSGRIRRGLGVALVLIIFVGLIAMLLSFTVPYAVDQVSSLVRDISSYASNLDELTTRAMSWLSGLHLPSFLLDKAGELLSKADVYLTQLFTLILEWLVNTSLGIFDVVVVFIVLIYLLLDGRKIGRSVLDHLPMELSTHLSRVLHEADSLTWKYLRSRVIVSGGMAIVTYLGLTVMGIRYAPLFAVFSFILDFIPYFGSLLAGVIEAVYALVTAGPGLAIAVAVFVLVVQQVEGNIVAPKVQAEAVGVHPITVMFALLACSEIWGPVGMLISTPVAGACKLAFREIYRYLTAGMETPASAAAAAAEAQSLSVSQAPPFAQAPETKSEAPTPPEKPPAQTSDSSGGNHG
ncbi:MAG: AI-2E family transporter [Clostridiaceae bacterium]|nr:AI-2E family transporter [Clostridiaceae bacterium]